MSWVTANLLPIGVIAALAIAGSFLVKDRVWRLVVVGTGLFAAALLVAGVLYVVLSAPGGEETDKERDRPTPLPTPDDRLESLSLPWDSEDKADWEVAELLAELSEASYLPPVDAYESFKALGFEQPIPLVDGSMIGYVAYHGDAAVIVFRGTDNNIDWIVNLARGATRTPNGPIHQGFHSAYQPMKPQVVKVLKDRPPKHLWVTGHSLGGALAVVCVHDLIENQGIEPSGLITFGQPMVARQPLATYLDQLLIGRFAHYVNGSDVVARLPPSYTHFGSLVWFTSEGVQRSKPKRLAFGTESIDDPKTEGVEVTPLTDQEFEQLQAELSKEARPKMRADDGSPVYGANSRFIDDHAMQLYLENIRGISRARGPQ